jgi:hypothetical protein
LTRLLREAGLDGEAMGEWKHAERGYEDGILQQECSARPRPVPPMA